MENQLEFAQFRRQDCPNMMLLLTHIEPFAILQHALTLSPTAWVHYISWDHPKAHELRNHIRQPLTDSEPCLQKRLGMPAWTPVWSHCHKNHIFDDVYLVTFIKGFLEKWVTLDTLYYVVLGLLWGIGTLNLLENTWCAPATNNYTEQNDSSF